MRTFQLSAAIFSGVLLLSSCALEQDDAAPAEAPTAEQTSALCLAPPNPPPADIGWVFSGPNMSKSFAVPYGTSECSRLTVAYGYVDRAGVRLTSLPTTQAACVGTTLTARFYRRVGSAWSYLGSQSESGVWSGGACQGPTVSHDESDDTLDEVRIHASASRTTCAGSFCGTTYGVGITVWGASYALN